MIKPLSKAKQMKLIKGGSIRVETGDSPLMVHGSRLKDISKKFSKKVGHTLSLSPEELHHNAHMEGGSLSDTAKTVFKSGVRMAAPLAKHAARAAIASGAVALGSVQPELLPFIAAGAPMLTGVSDHLFDHAGEYADHYLPDKKPASATAGAFSPSDYSSFQHHPAVKAVQRQAMSDPRLSHAVQMAANPHAAMNSYAGTNDGYMHDAGYGNAHAQLQDASNQLHAARSRSAVHSRHASEVAKSHLEHAHTRRMKGGGVSSRMEKGSLFLHGNLVGRGGVPQALMSQPYGVNFASRAFVSPAFQSLIH